MAHRRRKLNYLESKSRIKRLLRKNKGNLLQGVWLRKGATLSYVASANRKYLGRHCEAGGGGVEQREQACVTEHLTRQIVQGYPLPFHFPATTSAFRRRASISNREYEYKCKIQQVTIVLRAIVSATIVHLYRLCTGPGPGVIELWKSCFAQGRARPEPKAAKNMSMNTLCALLCTNPVEKIPYDAKGYWADKGQVGQLFAPLSLNR